MEGLQPEYKKREYLSYSTLLSFARCPRKYFYQKSGIFPQEEPTALLYGTAMHKAVDVGLREGLEAGVTAFLSVWDETFADDKRNTVRAKAQLSHFIHTHDKGRSIFNLLPPPEGTVQVDDATSPYEIPFAIDIGLPIPLTGRLDGWGVHRDTGEFWGREFKTMSRMGGGVMECLNLNPQLLTYALVLKTLTGKKISGIMFEAMLIDAKKVDNETHPIYIQDHMLDDILQWLRYHGELLLACEARGVFPKNFAGCSAYPMFYMPASKCEYTNLCTVPDYKDMVSYYSIRQDPVPLTIRKTDASQSDGKTAEGSVDLKAG